MRKLDEPSLSRLADWLLGEKGEGAFELATLLGVASLVAELTKGDLTWWKEERGEGLTPDIVTRSSLL